MAKLSFLFRLLLLIAFLPGVAIASVTTGTIKGNTIDEGGLPIPGVLVSITSDNMMGVRQANTDADGRFLFIELPPGVYQIASESPGFAKVKKVNLQVNIGRTTHVTVEMPMASAGEEIVVEEERNVIDTESANQGTVLTQEFLQSIPAGRSYQAAVQMAAGVTGGSNPNMAGSAYNENSYMLDGVNITDPVTGTFSLNFNFDAIEQIEVLTSAFDPEYGVNLGGGINIVTDSGGNTLTTRLGLYVINGNWSPRLDARYSADGAQLAPSEFDSKYESYDTSITITGPIVRDKAWFIVSYSKRRTLIAASGVELPRDFDGHYVLTKITVQPTTEHRFTVLMQTNPTTIDNLYASDILIEPEAQGRQAQGGFVTSLQWDWYVSPTSFLETKFLVQKIMLEGYGVPCTHDQDLGYHPCLPDERENSLDFVTPGRIGYWGAKDSDNETYFDFDDRWRVSLQSKFSLLQIEALGSHDFKVGAEGDMTMWKRLVGYTGNMMFLDVNLSTWDPDTLTNYYRYEMSDPIFFQNHAETMGAFLQDVYKPISNLTFRYGVRYDHQFFHNDVGETIISTGMFGPRLSVIWDPWSNQKTKFVGSIGRFNSTSRMSVAAALDVSDIGQKLMMGEYFGEFTSEANTNYLYWPKQITRSKVDELSVPRADMFQLGAERELIPDLKAIVYFNGKFTRNLYVYDEMNLIWDEDGYGLLGAHDGENISYLRVRTPDLARRDYYRTDVGLMRQLADRWQAQATYSYTVSQGSMQSTPSGQLLTRPGQTEFWLNGVLETDITHSVKSGFAWEIPNDPWTTEIGGLILAESGYPVTRSYDAGFSSYTILKEARGRYDRAEGYWNFNLLVRQAIPTKKGKLKARGEIQNITNNRQGNGAFVSFDNRWVISYRQDQMRFQVGGSMSFKRTVLTPAFWSMVTLWGLSCGYVEEGINRADIKVKVKIPADMLSVEMENGDGERWTIDGDPRSIGPVFLGLYSSVEPGHYSYLHPEMGPILTEGTPGDAYPYGGTTVGRFDWGCTQDTQCKIVTGRYDSYEDVLDYFRDQVRTPILDPAGDEYTSGTAYQEECFESRFYTSDNEVDFLRTEPQFQLVGDYWEAEITILQTYFQEGITLWGWVDMPSFTYDFVTCDESQGDEVNYYDFREATGVIRPGVLNFPGLYIDYGDLIATEGVIVNDADAQHEIILGFRNEE
jgi:hypothetical protein